MLNLTAIQILKSGAKKPTGSGYCPPEVKRALHVEGLINERAGTRDLNDSDFAADIGAAAEGAGNSSSDDEIEVLGHTKATHTAVARRAPTPPLRRSRMNAPELVNKLSQAFDPDTLRSRDDERAQRSFQSTQMFTMSQQLRDAHAAIENLRNQITTMQNHTHDVERARDRAEWKLETFQLGAGQETRGRASKHTNLKEHPDIVRVNGAVHCERIYPDGGACTYWVSDPSSDESEKENRDPSLPHRRRSPHASLFEDPSLSSSNAHLAHLSSDFSGADTSASGSGLELGNAQ